MTAPPPDPAGPTGDSDRAGQDRSVTVHGSNSGIISTGDNSTNNHYAVLPSPTPIAELDAPGGLVNLPPITSEFVGRADALTRIDAAVGGDGPVVVAAVHGLGGIGKSTLAARYASIHQDRFHPVWWIVADTPSALQAGLAALATALDPREAEGTELEALAKRALVWLATHSGWLLILDNVTDPADVAGLLGRVRSGRVVVTSRLGQGWHRLGAQVVRLEVLSEDEAVDLLTRLAQPDNPDPDVWPGAADLVAELGCLPLAVDQVGAYLHQTSLTPTAYLNLLRDQPEVFLGRTPEGAVGERTIAQVWQVTLEHLSARTPLAGDLLRILAWLAPEAIPRTYLVPLTRSRPGAHRRKRWRRTQRGWGTEALTDQAGLTDVLGLLAAYNMITLTAETISMHRLVQAVARTPDPENPHRRADQITVARDTTALLLARAQPWLVGDPSVWPALRELLPHLTAYIDHAPPATDTAATEMLLCEVGTFLYEHQVLDLATLYLQRSVTVSERLNGRDAPETLASRNNLADAYRLAGALDRAIPLLESVLSDCERVLGADHHNTLQTKTNIANAHLAAGDPDRAIPMLEAVLTARERVLGINNLYTLYSRSNLAIAVEAAGDRTRAIAMFEATLATAERILGSDNYSTLSFRNNLASTYLNAGDVARAIPLHEQTLADREWLLGPDHLDTMNSRGLLARAYRDAGDVARAIPLYEQTAADRERVQGSEHPNTLTSHNELAHAYQSAGALDQAIRLYEATLADCERVLGGDHPITQSVRKNLLTARPN